MPKPAQASQVLSATNRRKLFNSGHGCSPVLEGSITRDAPPLMLHCKHKALMKPERLEAFPFFGPGPCKRTVPFWEGFQISAGRDGAPRPSWLTRLARRQPAPRAVGLAPASRNSNPAQAPATEGTTKNSQTCASAFPPTRTAGPKLRAGFTESPVTLMKTGSGGQTASAQ